MNCDRWREAISAIADGEAPPVDSRLLEGHLARCAGCREYRMAVDATRGVVRVRGAAALPDLTGRIVKANAVSDRRSRWGLARVALAVVAVEVIAFSVPDLLGSGESSSAHVSRHLGAFSVAYAVMLLMVVARPTRARIVLPVAAVLAGALLLTGLIDLLRGEVPLVGEATHLPELISVGLLWLMGRPSAPPATIDGATWRSAQGRLRVVGEPGERDTG